MPSAMASTIAACPFMAGRAAHQGPLLETLNV
jgi:hypothetical protein